MGAYTMSATTCVLLILLTVNIIVGLGLTIYTTVKDEQKYGKK